MGSYNIKHTSTNRVGALIGAIYLLFIMGCSANAVPFNEGEHYSVLDNPTPASSDSAVKVIEFFNYACPHCFHLEKNITEWKKTKADYIEFTRVPAFWNPTFEHMAKAFYTAELLGKIDLLHSSIFDAIHVRKRNIKTPEALADLFSQHGVEKDMFNKTYNSFAVQQKLSLASSQFKEYQLRAVPSFVIDGTYVTSIRDAGGKEKLIKLIDFLAKKAKLAKAEK